MEELLEKIEKLKISLDNEEIVKKIKKLNTELDKDKGLLELLSNYKTNPTQELKNQVYNNELYRKYKESETDLNLLILSINQKLKEISNKRSCG